jgi:hypothetical protein
MGPATKLPAVQTLACAIARQIQQVSVIGIIQETRKKSSAGTEGRVLQIHQIVLIIFVSAVMEVFVIRVWLAFATEEAHAYAMMAMPAQAETQRTAKKHRLHPMSRPRVLHVMVTATAGVQE